MLVPSSQSNSFTALHFFGKDAFFQPYLPLQQVDMLYAKTWLTGTTNQIVTQQKDCKYDVLVNVSSILLFCNATDRIAESID